MSFTEIKKLYPKKIHFIGIGGIGMSAIAIILHKIGCQVQGSDLARNGNINNLELMGIKCFIGHSQENINDDLCLIIKTSIVKDSNPEIIAALEKQIPTITRAQMLTKIMEQKTGITVAGTHGKTSTTAIISVILDSAGLDPTVINGGIINYFGSNAKLGHGQYLVAESDESDGSFVDLPSFIGVVTNIEADHLESYGEDFTKLKKFFQKYIEQIPDNGLAVLCLDDPEIKKIYQKLKTKKNNLITYGLDQDADLAISNITSNSSGLKFDVKFKKSNQLIKDLNIPAYGVHNAKNASAAIAIASFLGLDEKNIRQALNKYSGVKRRFTKTGEVAGITIIDDYGHHPTEIIAVFKAARQLVGKNKVIAVFQPHKYTRTRDLFNEFCHAFYDTDIAIIADIYSAGQDKIVGISQDSLILGIKNSGHKNVIKLEDQKDLAKIINQNAKSGDIVICAGAGNISNWANNLPKELEKFYN